MVQDGDNQDDYDGKGDGYDGDKNDEDEGDNDDKRRVALTKRMNFRKCSKAGGGRVNFQSRILYCRF